MSSEKNRVIIIGSGPAALTAAIYTSRANLDVLCIAGYASGGQLMLTSEVENFPGFPEGIMGPELMGNMRAQAERFGTRFIEADASKVDFSGTVHRVWIEDEVYEAEAVIVATGASAKWLGLESEQRLVGRGVSSCATCDGFFFRNKEIAVIGGGDTALEEALFLTKFASKVSLIHRRDKFRASKIMQERASSHPKINIIYDTAIEEVLGETNVTGVKLRNLKTDEVTELPLSGVFVAIGHQPNTSIFNGALKMNESGYIEAVGGETLTSETGVFVAGDVFDFRYRQAITAAGSGCKAALEAEKYLEGLHSESEEALTAAN
ncbi:MAG: thioredoxin-disulfide reductase [Chloroflexi bacterium]|uniref:Thioredoxin reductase n=1 Tax=Candidatus Chlorohelix allophototropha TaxID=3003348 RepID=A0A8T7M763_9CHLR|nr:thioredoxin-disulfide reductase [Chloroflexota bacterium]WJW69892.1 thioredoxin-disulfide reductase [Chloroflexota bacterium L227-S17]